MSKITNFKFKFIALSLVSLLPLAEQVSAKEHDVSDPSKFKELFICDDSLQNCVSLKLAGGQLTLTKKDEKQKDVPADLKVNTLDAGNATFASVNTTGGMTVAGVAKFNGNIVGESASFSSVNTTGNGYFNTISVSSGGPSVTDDGWSSWIKESGKGSGGTSSYTCSSGVMIGREHSGDENGMTRYKCARIRY